MMILVMARWHCSTPWSSPVRLLFLFFCSVFSHSFPVSFTRDELLNIKQHTADIFDGSDILLKVLVGGAAVLFKHAVRQKHTGALVKLCKHGFPTVHPSNESLISS